MTSDISELCALLAECLEHDSFAEAVEGWQSDDMPAQCTRPDDQNDAGVAVAILDRFKTTDLSMSLPDVDPSSLTW
jgi:hypothetical protein